MGEERGNREDRDREDVCVHVCVSFSLSGGRSLTVVLLPTANEHVFASTASVEAVLYALRTHIKLADVVESCLYTINSLARNGANRQDIVANAGHELLITIATKWYTRSNSPNILSSLLFHAANVCVRCSCLLC